MTSVNPFRSSNLTNSLNFTHRRRFGLDDPDLMKIRLRWEQALQQAVKSASADTDGDEASESGAQKAAEATSTSVPVSTNSSVGQNVNVLA